MTQTKLDESTIDIKRILSNISDIIESDFSYILNILIKYNIHQSWYELFISNHVKLSQILKQIDKARSIQTIYPPENLVFRVFEADITDIQIVLLGQDPYIRKDQAMGLSFSVPQNIMTPPSLVNIFKELKLEFPERNYNFTHGDLTKWSNNGIFLLNSALTVIEGRSNSQQSMWSWFTDKVIEYINTKRSNVIFLLLGRNATDKHIYVNQTKNKIVCGVHPSPMSAHTGFFNSNIFKKVEEKLNHQIDWSN